MKRTIALVAMLAGTACLNAADVRVGANITADTVWTKDNTYFLDAQVYVTDNAALTIEAGTVIKGAANTTAATALIITRGAKVYAMGSPSEPIVFTAESDPLDGSFGADKTNLWGGVIILGAAPVNSQKQGVTGDFLSDPQVATLENIEGLDNQTSNTWTEFGGLDPEDSSGIFRYVSIRHGGSEIGSGNEINGLTMGGVGRGTIVEFVEVYANKDDAFEWFGGTVDGRFLVAAYCNDESFDYDQGWTGRGQFWFTIGTTGVAGNEEMDHAGEHDGTANFSQTPPNHPYRGMGDIFNATFVGANQNEEIFSIEDEAGVHYYNSIFTDFAGKAVAVAADAISGLTEVEDGVTRIDFRNNIWYNFGSGATKNTTADLSATADVVTFLTESGKANTIEDPEFYGISRTNDGGLDPRPMPTSPAFSNARKAIPDDGWYIAADYQGAFGEKNWMNGWTKLAEDGYLPATNEVAAARPGALSANLRVPDGATGTIDFAVYGDLPSMFLIRAAGPKLADYGVSADLMADPMITVRNFITREVVAQVSGWTDRADMVELLSAQVGLFTLTADGTRTTDDQTSAVAIVTLNPGVYTVSITDENGGGGFVQASAFNVDL